MKTGRKTEGRKAYVMQRQNRARKNYVEREKFSMERTGERKEEMERR